MNSNSVLQINSLREIQVTIGKNVMAPNEISNTTLGAVLDEIRSNGDLKNRIEFIRSLPTKPERDNIKKKLPYFVAALLRGYKNKESFQSAEILIFDLDHLREYEFDTIRKSLEEWKYSSVVFTSPSGKGLKLIVRVNRTIIDINLYYRVYKEISDVINAEFNIRLDPQTCDPARACFLSSDEYIYVNEDASAFEYTDEQKESSAPVSTRRENVLNIMSGVSEGERHSALVTEIGMFIKKGLDKDFIKKTAYGINQLNNPPFSDDEFDKEFESIYRSFSKSTNPDISFKLVKETKTGIKVSIDSSKLIDFLSEHGFKKVMVSPSNIVFVRAEGHLLRQVSIVHVKDYLESYIKECNDTFKGAVRDIIIKGNQTYLSEGALSFLPSIIPNTKRGTKDRAYLFFNNVYIEITPDQILVNDYSQLKGEHIWSESIIDRDLDIECFHNDNSPSEYSTMLNNICRKEDVWYNALTCAIGYIAHDYKDKANAKAIIFCDEEIPAADDSNGGTGKSLVCEGLKYLRKTIVVDGKNFRTDSSFIFQNIDLNTEIVVLDDVRKTFDFESLFSVITSDLTIEKKHRPPFTIPFEESPKFIITTNFTISGNGNSVDRRKHEIEFSNYYNKSYTPKDEFGHRLFDEWNNIEWTRFYKAMAVFIQKYLMNGLVKYEVRNLRTRRVVDVAGQDFFDFAQDNISPNEEYRKKDLLKAFHEQYPEFSQLKGKTFTRWLKVYADTFNLKLEERKSNKDRYIIFSGDVPNMETESVDDMDEFDNEDKELR